MPQTSPIYLDYNATTPLAPEVWAAMRPWFEQHFGNPSSSHAFGRPARAAVENARGEVARLLGASPEEIVFTGGGTEANNLAIIGAAQVPSERGRHLVTTAVEHPAVLEVCRWLAGHGFELTVVPVDGCGRVDPAAIQAALTPRTILVSVMHANNEVGTVQPLAEIAALTRPRGVLLHADAAQSAGKIPVRVDELGVDLLTVAGHKLYAPKGVGALYVRRGVRLARVTHGAGQEGGLRPGTENVPAIVGLGAACRLADDETASRPAELRACRDLLWQLLAADLADIRWHGQPASLLPNTLSVGFRGVSAAALMQALEGFLAVSAGAACHSAGVTLSATLRAMGVPEEYAAGTLRFSAGRPTTAAEVRAAAGAVIGAVRSLRG